MIITIDGPCGVGKSTHSTELAKAIGFEQLDSGALYRAVTFHCLRSNADFSDPKALAEVAATAEVDMRITSKGREILLRGEVVADDDLRDPKVARHIAPIADMRDVRERVNEVQRRVAKGNDYVLDGRDTGTVVFPAAEIKIFLTAEAQDRAQRRYKQLLKKRGPEESDSFEVVLQDLEERDRRDRGRPFGALKQAPDAIIVDSTGNSFEETLNVLIETVKSHPAWTR